MNKAVVIGGSAAVLLVLGAWFLGSQASGYQCTVEGEIVQQSEPCPAPAVTEAPSDTAAPPAPPSAPAEDETGGLDPATAFYDPNVQPPLYHRATPADLVTASPQSMFSRLQQACASRNEVDFFRNFSHRFRKAYATNDKIGALKRKARFDEACAELATPLLVAYAAGPDFSIVPGSQSELCSLPTPTTACISGWHVVVENGQLKLDQF